MTKEMPFKERAALHKSQLPTFNIARIDMQIARKR